MTTHERELTAPVDLCTDDGRHLSDAAIGWSRRPLHRANLGGWGRNKRWDYWALLAPEMAVAVTYADIDYLGLVSVWWVDLTTGHEGGREVLTPLARGVDLPDVAGAEPLTFRHRKLQLDIRDDEDTTRIDVRWRERDGVAGSLQAEVARPPARDSVNVVIPWSRRRFQFTSKQVGRPTTGTLVVGDKRWVLGGQTSGLAVLDVGRGRWPYRTRWNWGAAVGPAPNGGTVGVQMGGTWTVGTGHTENGVVVDGVVEKLGDELDWSYDWDVPLNPWRVRSPDGRLDLTLAPRHDRHAVTRAAVVSTEVHQVFGRWNGWIPTPGGDRLEVVDLLGFAEESRSRW